MHADISLLPVYNEMYTLGLNEEEVDRIQAESVKLKEKLLYKTIFTDKH